MSASPAPRTSVGPAHMTGSTVGPLRLGRRQAGKAAAFALLLLGCTAIVHIWIISAGRWTDWPQYGKVGYYSLLADGFLEGQLNLAIDPSPDLLSLPNPYDARANAGLRLHDAVLYNAKYYLYWGPAPALLLMPLKLISALNAPPIIGDQYLVFAFAIGTVTFSTVVILRARSRLFPEQPWWTVGFGIAAAGLMYPMPYGLARPMVYEAAILGGQCFLMAGLWLSWLAIDAQRGSACAALAAAAGFAWAAAASSRMSLAPAILVLAGLVIIELRRRTANRCQPHDTTATVAAFLLPLLGAIAAGAWYNSARFGSPLEFGTRYQLAGGDVSARGAAGLLMSTRCIVPNLVRCLFEAPALSRSFPYLTAATPSVLARLHIPTPPVYEQEKMVGIVWVAPLLLFAAIAFRHSPTPREPPSLPPLPDAPPRRERLRWLQRSLFLAAFLSMLPSQMVIVSTSRYLLDASPAIAVLSMIGIWSWLASPKGHGLKVVALTALTAGSVIAVLLLSITGPAGHHFLRNNPELFHAMERGMSFR